MSRMDAGTSGRGCDHDPGLHSWSRGAGRRGIRGCSACGGGDARNIQAGWAGYRRIAEVDDGFPGGQDGVVVEEERVSVTYVVGTEHYEIVFEPYGGELNATLTVRVSGVELWRSTERSWRAVGIGNGTRSAYIWTARTLVELSASKTMWSAKFDEDLIWVYQDDAAWIAVCETSVRLVGTQGEVDRWELADVVAEADWRGEKIYVRDVAGREVFLRVRGEDFHPSAS